MWSPEPVHLTTSDGVSLAAHYYAGVSDGPSYLLGHGFTGNALQARVSAISTRLNERGASVLALDFRGHGASGGVSTIGVAEIADVAAGVLWLRNRRPGAPVITLGFSMGASIVVRHAGLGGSAEAVVAVSGPGRWYERGTEPMRRVHLGVETRLGRLALRLVFKTRVGGGWDLLPASPVEVASAVAAPMLVVHGDADPYFGLEHARMLAGATPVTELWIEAGMGHAESATTAELVDRIDDWARTAVQRSGSMRP
jgi:pimeloyl-ACP methyl ester carboxylesterase